MTEVAVFPVGIKLTDVAAEQKLADLPVKPGVASKQEVGVFFFVWFFLVFFFSVLFFFISFLHTRKVADNL